MFPSTGLNAPIGSKEYWPVYREADRLGCASSVHGGAHSGLGMDNLHGFAPIHALGHPVSLMICFASVIFCGILDKFPNVKMGFLEGGREESSSAAKGPSPGSRMWSGWPARTPWYIRPISPTR